MKVIVVDTNVLVSAYLKGGNPLKVIESLRNYDSISVVTTQLIAEHNAVLNREKFAPHFTAKGLNISTLLLEYAHISRYVTPVAVVETRLRDDKDLMVLECAVGGEAEFIVTGDKDLLTLEEHQDIAILTPSQYFQILEG